MNDFSYTFGCCSFSFQTQFILLIFHCTMYGVTVLFDVSDAALKQPPKDVMTFQNHALLKNPYVWSSLVIVLVVAIIAALAFALSEAESKNIPPGKAQL
jgi:hypothetical protein